jgi:hypothetical protein
VGGGWTGCASCFCGDTINFSWIFFLFLTFIFYVEKSDEHAANKYPFYCHFVF